MHLIVGDCDMEQQNQRPAHRHEARPQRPTRRRAAVARAARRRAAARRVVSLVSTRHNFFEFWKFWMGARAEIQSVFGKKKGLYAILEIAPAATQAEIKKAYFKLALKLVCISYNCAHLER